MKNFIFKSQKDFHKILFNKLDMILAELRFERSEHSLMLTRLRQIMIELNLREQASEYYKKYGEDETSPQTDLEEHFEPKPGDIRVD